MSRRCCWSRLAPTPFSRALWWYHRNRSWQRRSSARREVRGRRVPCCGATAVARSACHQARGSRSGAAPGRCSWPGCAAAPSAPPALSAPLAPAGPARTSGRPSLTGWWRSSASRSRAGAAGPGRGRTLPRGWETRSRLAMLEEVRISGLGVIDEAVLELSPGFNVVTGETGAGKTMVVSGLGLLFGGRADPRRIRPGAERATVEGRLRTDPDGEVARQVNNAGGDLDDDATLVLTRSVSAEGRSRAFAGGRSVPVSLLTYLADDLVAVHGQADQQKLLKPGRQREALDRFAGPEHAAVLTDYQRCYQRLRDIRGELAELTSQARDRAREAEDLRRGLAEIEHAEPASGEDIDLLAEDERLSHADALHAAATAAHEALQSDPSSGLYEASDALTLLAGARQALEAAAQHDAALAALAARLSEAAYLISDVAAELASYAQGVEADPARLAIVQERRAELARLVRAYGSASPADGTTDGAEGAADGAQGAAAQGTATSVSPDDGDLPAGSAGPAASPAASAAGRGSIAAVLGWAKQAAARLAELDGADDKIAGLAEQEAALAAAVGELAGRLSAGRKHAAERFAADVTAELAALAMPHARLTVAVTP